MTKIAGSGSGSISQRHGSADPDPDPPQNVMDPQHWLAACTLRGFNFVRTDFSGIQSENDSYGKNNEYLLLKIV
jgi:hypothetical protein